MEPHESITLEEARLVISAAEKKANAIGQPMNIAVVCAGGHLLAFARMPKAWLGSVDIAIKKAWTSRAFDIETKALGKLAQPGADFYGIHASNGGKVMIFAGGVPIKRGDTVVGAIGVSGGSGKQDQQVAEAGAAALS
jgi:uncharacterized protein GlcG (DUF336 family)